MRADWLAALRLYLLTMTGGNLLWEIAQLPLYTIWTAETLGGKVFAVAHCTAGDVLIGLFSIAVALVVAGDRDWPTRRFRPVFLLTLLLGISYTAFSEWLNIAIQRSWEYSDRMPVITLLNFELGLSPLLQWLLVPSLAFWLIRRLRP